MKNIVISLSNAHDRRSHIQQEFSKKNISFDFFDALTPVHAKPLAEKMKLIIKDENLSEVELACLMSHVAVWKKMIYENIPYMAIFEDDIFLGENADRYLTQNDWIDPDWHIIKLEAFAPRIFMSSQGRRLYDNERRIYQLLGKNLGAAGYILSLKGAQAYLDYLHSKPLIAIDQIMFDDYIQLNQLQVYQISPAICIQEMMLLPEKQTVLSSDLFKERKVRMRKYKKKGWAKFQLELRRIIHRIRMQLFGREVKFK